MSIKFPSLCKKRMYATQAQYSSRSARLSGSAVATKSEGAALVHLADETDLVGVKELVT